MEVVIMIGCGGVCGGWQDGDEDGEAVTSSNALIDSWQYYTGHHVT